MYYQELIERLWRFNENTRLGATAIAMYLYLLKLGEQNNSYVIKISDTVLSNILGIHRNTVKPFREKLKNLGLIQYTTKNGFPCTYRILLNYSFESFKEESEKNLNKTKDGNHSHQKNKPLKLLEPHKEMVSKHEQKNKNILQDLNGIQPSWDEFIQYAKTLDSYKTEMDSDIKEKYHTWKKNNWLNNFGRPIKNWKSSLKSVLPYLSNNLNSENTSIEIPIINRPKYP